MNNETPRTIGPVTTASAGGAALGTILVWVGTLAGLNIPGPVEAALVVLLTIIGGWLVKPGTGTRRK